MPKDTELHKLCGKGDFDGVQSLLSPSAKPVNVDEPGSSGRTPLHRAIGANANDMVKLLVEAHGASLTTVDATGRSILQFAVIAKNAAMLQYLLEKDESMINHLTEKGSSCLHLAVNTGAHACIEHLLNRNIDTQLKNKNNQTAFEIAEGKKDKDVIAIFRRYKVPGTKNTAVCQIL